MKNRITSPMSLIAILTLLAFEAKGLATDQEMDAIRIGHNTSYLIEVPMNFFWTAINPKPEFDPESTSNWKGYTTSWEVKDNKLFLTSFSANLNRMPIDARKMFGGPLPIEAIWVNGPLHVIDAIERKGRDRYAATAKRLFLVDGIVAKEAVIKEPVRCDWGRVGIRIGNKDGTAFIEKLAVGSPTAIGWELSVGDELVFLVDLDDQRVPIGKCSIEKATQLLSGLLNQPLRIGVRARNTLDIRTITLERAETFLMN